VVPVNFQAPPTIGSGADYWKRRNVTLLDVVAVLGEERTIELGRN
jgi:hypothetical protein